MKLESKVYPSPYGDITIYKITNDKGAYVELSTFGAGIRSVVVPDKNGKMADVTIGYANPADYMADGPCAGKTPGRFGNRIAKGKLELDGVEYDLPINNGPNHLHGGPEGFQNQNWKGEAVGDDTVKFSLTDPDGHMGYPGTVKATVTYAWNDADELTIKYHAETDKATVVNLTNHAYWNLAGHDTGSALNHTLKMYAHNWLPTDDTLIPTGEIQPVAGTPMDFTGEKALGRDIKADFPALKYGKGYDNCWVADDYDGSLRLLAVLRDPVSGRVLEVFSTQPGAQVYTGNWLEGAPESKSHTLYHDYDAVAIECQHFPDSPHHPAFPGTVLRPGEALDETIVYGFKAE